MRIAGKPNEVGACPDIPIPMGPIVGVDFTDCKNNSQVRTKTDLETGRVIGVVAAAVYDPAYDVKVDIVPHRDEHKHHLYLAGPFFNPVQVELQETVEGWCNNLNIDYFSPRLHAGRIAPNATPEQRRKVVSNDLNAITRCSVVFANLDWAMPYGDRLLYTKFVSNNSKFLNTITSPVQGNREVVDWDIKLPDSGTVFEMGFANAMNVPVVGYTVFDEKVRKLNIMMTETCFGICRGTAMMHEFLWQLSQHPDDAGLPGLTTALEKAGALLPWKGATE